MDLRMNTAEIGVLIIFSPIPGDAIDGRDFSSPRYKR